MTFGFIGPTYQSASICADGEECINFYPEVVESGHGKSNLVLYGTPGLTLLGTLPTSPLRGLWAGDGRLFAVSGSKYYEVFSNGTYTLRGDVGNFSTPVTMVDNGTQILIVSGNQAYIDNGTSVVPCTFPGIAGTVNTAGTAVTWVSGDDFDLSLIGATIVITAVNYTVASVTDSTHLVLTSSAGVQAGAAYTAIPLVTAIAGCYIDGYFVVLRPNTNQINISAPLNGSSWDPLDFDVKEGGPDRLEMIFADHEELWQFGQKTIEVWYNSGAADFPFQRIQGAFIEQGIWAPFSVAKIANSIMWLGGDERGVGVVWRAEGLIPKRVSNHAVETAIQAYATSSDAIAFSYQDGGHQFYVLSFPTADVTWVYDISTNMWHKRAYWDGAAYHSTKGRYHAFTFGKHLVGDYGSGNIYQQSLTLYTDNGSAIRRLRSSPHVSKENTWIDYAYFWLDMQVGVAPGSTVGVTVQISRDGGFTWGVSHALSTGATGAYRQRVKLNRLGRARDFAIRAIFVDPIQTALVDAYLNAKPGTGA